MSAAIRALEGAEFRLGEQLEEATRTRNSVATKERDARTLLARAEAETKRRDDACSKIRAELAEVQAALRALRASEPGGSLP